MWRDFLYTNRVNIAIADTREILQDAFPDSTLPKAPMCPLIFLPSANEYWSTALERFPKSHRSAGGAFQVDRILPLPRPIREALIAIYFDEDETQQARAK